MRKLVRLLLTFLAFVGIWLLLTSFGSTLIDEQEAIGSLRQRFQFLRPGITQVLVEVPWLLIAAIATLWLSPRLSSPANSIADWLSSTSPLFLAIPKKSDNPLDYRSRSAKHIGQSGPASELAEFFKSKDKFQWWLLVGEAGSGKSRLALEWLLFLSQGIWRRVRPFHIGFYTGIRSPEVWREWEPNRTTVIVVDNAGERVDDVLKMINVLSSLAHKQTHKIRLLLVDQALPARLKFLEEESRFYEFQHRNQPLRPVALSSNQLKLLLKSMPSEGDRSLDLAGIDRIVEASKGNPLNAIVARELVRDQDHSDLSTADEILKQWAKRTRAKLKHAGLDETTHPVLALATFIRGLPWDSARGYSKWSESITKPLVESVIGEDAVESIPAIKPHLAAEAFVVDVFRDLSGPERLEFIRKAWEIRPVHAGLSLYNVGRDLWSESQPLFKSIESMLRGHGDASNLDAGASLSYWTANAYLELGKARTTSAGKYARRGLAIHEHLGSLSGSSRDLLLLGRIHLTTDDNSLRCLIYFERALIKAEKVDNPDEQNVLALEAFLNIAFASRKGDNPILEARSLLRASGLTAIADSPSVLKDIEDRLSALNEILPGVVSTVSGFPGSAPSDSISMTTHSQILAWAIEGCKGDRALWQKAYDHSQRMIGLAEGKYPSVFVMFDPDAEPSYVPDLGLAIQRILDGMQGSKVYKGLDPKAQQVSIAVLEQLKKTSVT